MKKGTRFKIYQLIECEKTKHIQFANYAHFESKNYQPEFENYENIFEASVKDGSSIDDVYGMLDENLPCDYKTKKIVTSDIIVIDDYLKTKAYYIDKDGYVEIPSFAVDHDLSLGRSIDILDYLEKPRRLQKEEAQERPSSLSLLRLAKKAASK